MVCVIVVRIETDVDAGVLTPIALMATRFPGAHRIRLLTGKRMLTLGPESACDPSEACLSALREFGDVDVLTDLVGGEGTGPFDADPVPSPDEEAT